MRKNPLQAASLEGNADDVEAAFYDALQNGDVDKLMSCWADEGRYRLCSPWRTAAGRRYRHSRYV